MRNFYDWSDLSPSTPYGAIIWITVSLSKLTGHCRRRKQSAVGNKILSFFLETAFTFFSSTSPPDSLALGTFCSAMSLTARISNLFSPDSSSPLAASSESVLISEHDDIEPDGAEFALMRKAKRLRTVEKAKEDDEYEVKRAPYLHVRSAYIICRR